MSTFDPPFNQHRAARGLAVLDEVAVDEARDEVLVSYAFDVDLTDIVWMLSQVAPDLEQELRDMLLAKLPAKLLDKKNGDIPAVVRAAIDAWRRAYRQHPYSADLRVRQTLRDLGADENKAKPGARANLRQRHASCCRTSRAAASGDSALTLGKVWTARLQRFTTWMIYAAGLRRLLRLRS